ncbi:hypothetical protein OM322_21135 [Escherichia albertii]|nr:hypothetical protein [Escherichia albertii]
MRKLLLPLLFMAGTVNAASSVKEICTDYTKFLVDEKDDELIY